MRRRAAWVVVVLAATMAWCAPAGAAIQVKGSLKVGATTPTTVSLTVIAQRTCTGDEQCDYFAEVDQLAGDDACPSGHPADPWYLWTGAVQNTGPTTESGTVTPRGWTARALGVAPSRVCLYVYADDTYTLLDSATITRPDPPPAGTSTPGGTAPGGTTPGGGPSPAVKDGCGAFTYQQSAQKALDADRSLAAALDHNHNGVACQDLPKRKTYVKTVAVAAAAAATRTALRKAYRTAFTNRGAYRASCHRRSRIRVRCTVSWRHRGTWSGYVDVTGAIRRNAQATLTSVHVRRPRAARPAA